MDVQLQVGVAVPDESQHGGQQVRRDGGDDAEVQRTGERTAGRVDLLGEGVQGGQHPARVIEHALAQRGDDDPARRTLDELRAE